MECTVCIRCLDAAIDVENAAREYYERMAGLFSEHRSAAMVFSEMARDEQDHARMLEKARSNRDHSPAIHGRAEEFRKTLERLSKLVREHGARLPRNLDEVYEFAYQVERSEVNGIYITLTTESLEPAGERGFIVSLIGTHLKRLGRIAEVYDQDQRRLITPQNP